MTLHMGEGKDGTAPPLHLGRAIEHQTGKRSHSSKHEPEPDPSAMPSEIRAEAAEIADSERAKG